jgi:hypothetical protein
MAVWIEVAAVFQLVTNGVYETGGVAVFGTMTNRAAVTKPLTVHSVNGPGVTAIVGSPASAGGNGDGAIRCALLVSNAVLSGFTLSNGHTRSNGDIVNEQSGGGVWCETGAVVRNCVLRDNSAADVESVTDLASPRPDRSESK